MRNRADKRHGPSRAASALLLGLLCPGARAQDGAMEEFAELDPYTEGEREKMDALGYVTYAPFPWRGSDRTVDVQQNMGAIPMLWVETAHFRIGSSLGTYSIPNDREERALLKREIAELKEKLGRLRAPRKKLDPWLRLHLYAQRAENLYAAFVEDFGLEPADYEETGPHLGQTEKHLLLVCERKSEFVRYLRTYMDDEDDYSYRWGWPEGGLFFATNMESIRTAWDRPDEEPFETMMHCQVVSGLASNFIDGYRRNIFGAPPWIAYAAGHVYARRVDPRWVPFAGRHADKGRRDEDWKWEPRVYNLVKNDFFAAAEDMFAWSAYGDLNERDHMVAWSKLDYLMRVAEGDPKAFLHAVCVQRVPGGEDRWKADRIAHQTQGLEAAYGLDPARLDEEWATWVKKTYSKR